MKFANQKYSVITFFMKKIYSLLVGILICGIGMAQNQGPSEQQNMQAGPPKVLVKGKIID